MFKLAIKNRVSGGVMFTAELEKDAGKASLNLGLAVKWGLANKKDLTRAYLRGANLTDANLTDADLTDADLTDAYLRGAYLRGANLTGADLTDAYLRGAYLRGANLTDANLTGANLTGADLTGAKGIVSFGPVGEERRIGFVGWKSGQPEFSLGCFTGTLKQAQTAIVEKYGKGSSYEAMVVAAVAVLHDLCPPEKAK